MVRAVVNPILSLSLQRQRGKCQRQWLILVTLLSLTTVLSDNTKTLDTSEHRSILCEEVFKVNWCEQLASVWSCTGPVCPAPAKLSNRISL